MLSWFEVFLSDKNGTRTLQLCNSLKETLYVRHKMLERKNWKIKNYLLIFGKILKILNV